MRSRLGWANANIIFALRLPNANIVNISELWGGLVHLCEFCDAGHKHQSSILQKRVCNQKH